MAEVGKKYRLLFRNPVKGWEILVFDDVKSMVEARRSTYQGSQLIRFVAARNGNVSFDTKEEAEEHARDKTLVKPLVPDDLPLDARLLLYRIE
jgi:hypothetical protein